MLSGKSLTFSPLHYRAIITTRKQKMCFYVCTQSHEIAFNVYNVGEYKYNYSYFVVTWVPLNYSNRNLFNTKLFSRIRIIIAALTMPPNHLNVDVYGAGGLHWKTQQRLRLCHVFTVPMNRSTYGGDDLTVAQGFSMRACLPHGQ